MSEMVDRIRYPLAWDASYEQKGIQWRGGTDVATHVDYLDLEGAVLEMGAGNGNTASQVIRFLPSGASFFCIDVAGRALALMPVRLRSRERFAAMRADAREMPFRDVTFTAIFARHILTHAIEGDEARMLSEMRRVVKPGGRALIEVFSPNDMRFGKGDKFSRNVFVHGNDLIWRFYTEEELRGDMSLAGLKPIRIETVSKRVRYGGKGYLRESVVAIGQRN